MLFKSARVMPWKARDSRAGPEPVRLDAQLPSPSSSSSTSGRRESSRLPFGPLTVTLRFFSSTETPFGTLIG